MLKLAIACLALLVFVFAQARAAGAETRYEQARRIVYAVFPDSTQDRALSVVGCETGGTYKAWAKNPRSGALGWFQFVPGNHGRLISWGRWSLRVDYFRMWQPWYATRAALILSAGGTNWGEWSAECRP